MRASHPLRRLALALAALGAASCGWGPADDHRPSAAAGGVGTEDEVLRARTLTQGFDQASQRLFEALDTVHPASLKSMLASYTQAADKQGALQELNRRLEAALRENEAAEALDYRIIFYVSDVQAGWRATLDPETPHERTVYHGTAPFRGMGAAKVLTDEIAIPNAMLTPGRHELVFELLPRERGYFVADVEVIGRDREGRDHSIYRWRIVDHEDLADLQAIGSSERPWYRLDPLVLQVRVDPGGAARVDVPSGNSET